MTAVTTVPRLDLFLISLCVACPCPQRYIWGYKWFFVPFPLGSNSYSFGSLCHRAYCLKPVSEQSNKQSAESLLWIPPKLVDVALRDPELSSHFFGHLIKGGLFPAKMPIKDAARHFAAIYLRGNAEVRMNAKFPEQLLHRIRNKRRRRVRCLTVPHTEKSLCFVQERNILLRPAKNRHLLQQLLMEYVSLRSERLDGDSPEKEKKIARNLQKIGAVFLQDPKACHNSFP